MLTCRFAQKSDAQALLDIYAYYVEKTAITFEYDVPTLEDFQSRIENTLKKYPYLVALKDDKIVGYAYAGTFHAREAYDWAVETSIYVDHAILKAGVGRFLHNELEKVLKMQGILNMNACIAYPRGEDPYLDCNSVEFHSYFGYRMVGRFDQCGYKFNRWYDMVWMEKHIGKHLVPQSSILPISTLINKYQSNK